jgi:hypothetical protein
MTLKWQASMWNARRLSVSVGFSFDATFKLRRSSELVIKYRYHKLNITNLTSSAVAEFQNDNKILKEQFKMLKKLIFYQNFNIILKFCNCITGQVCYAGLPSCWHSSGGFVWKAPRHSAWQQIKCNTQHKGSVVMLRVMYGECHLCSKSWHRLKAAFLRMPSCLYFFIKTLWKWITQDLL